MIFEIPGIPPSTNQSLTICGNRLGHSPVARAYRKSTEIAIENQLNQQIRLNKALPASLQAMEGEPLYLHIKLYSNWITKAGTIRKTDLANREKLVCDSLISVLQENKYSIDDSQFYLVLLTKHSLKDGDEDKTILSFDLIQNFKLV